MKWRKYLTFEVLVRVLADVVIVNLAYLAALLARVLWRITADADISASAQLSRLVETYVSTAWLLTLIALVAYSLSGFYSRGRFYRGRFKALVIFQAVTLVYLIFGAIVYLALVRNLLLETPGSALVAGWFLTVVVTVSTRLWAIVWRLVIKRESPALRALEQDGRIHHVLVVGGAGYIGSVLCRQLLNKGYSVRVLDALLYGKESLAELQDHPRFELHEGDSRDVGAVIRAMLDMDAVVHLGELVGDPACALDERLTLEINLAATRMLAEAARGYGVKRFIYASSCSVYGAGSEILDERSGLNPVSLYARSKIASEQALLALNGPDFHPVILRLATVYGLSPRPRFDLVVNVLTAKAVREGEITIFGGDQWRPFVHVADVARAIVCCLEAPLTSVKKQVFNVGSDEQNYTIGQVGDLIHGLIPEARLLNKGNDVDKRDYHVSFAKIHNALGFGPQYTMVEGVREIEAVLREGRIDDYRDKRYSNYQTLSDPENHLSIRSRNISDLYAIPAMEVAANGPLSVAVGGD
jgi:nucleoside-diphosphate-sugar epimerase